MRKPDDPEQREESGRERVRSVHAVKQLGRAVFSDSKVAALWMRGILGRLRVSERVRLVSRRGRTGLGKATAKLRSLRENRLRKERATGSVPPEAPSPRRPGRRSRLTIVASALATMTGALSLLLAGLLAWALWGMDFAGAAGEERTPSIVMEAIDEQVFATKGSFKGTPVPLSQVPPDLIGAVVAIEDRRFFDHPGVDAIGIFRALFANIAAGQIVQGGSTISQQLARNLFLTQDRTLKRKIREAALAVWLEARLTKEEIIARYLGSIYMGAGVYGVSAAAKVYFGKDANDLTLAESAMLAGLIQAPSDLNPRADIAAARNRAAVVLDAMVETGAISQAEADAAKAAPAELDEAASALRSGGWFADWVYEEATELAGSFNGALHVRTTLHLRVQEIAEGAVARVMEAEGPGADASEAALVAMLADGAVLAIVGGRDYQASQFNRATDALRQPGSTFKPFVYYAALRRGWSMNDTIQDAPVEIDGWRPQNYGGGFRGRVSLAQALASSLNAATARLAQEVGIDAVAEAARELGIDAELKATPSLALGTSEVTLLDLTGAYVSLLAGKAPVEPWGVLEFGTAGNERYRLGPRTPAEPISPDLRMQMLDALTLAVERGTGRAARLDRAVAGKTGTTQDHRDAWFIGFTGPFAAGIWVGNDDNSPMDGVTGGQLPAKIWRAFMTDFMDMLTEGDPVFQAVSPGEVGKSSPDALRSGDETAGRLLSAGRDGNFGRGRELSCNVQACERAYRSFRRSDCTFQPYRGPRKHCAK